MNTPITSPTIDRGYARPSKPQNRYERAPAKRAQVTKNRALPLLRAAGHLEVELDRIAYKTWIWVAHENPVTEARRFS